MRRRPMPRRLTRSTATDMATPTLRSFHPWLAATLAALLLAACGGGGSSSGGSAGTGAPPPGTNPPTAPGPGPAPSPSPAPTPSPAPSPSPTPPPPAPPPAILALDIRGAPPAGGTPVVITGSGFQAGLVVTFGAAQATAVAVNVASGSITCTTPAQPEGIYDVVV